MDVNEEFFEKIQKNYSEGGGGSGRGVRWGGQVCVGGGGFRVDENAMLG